MIVAISVSVCSVSTKQKSSFMLRSVFLGCWQILSCFFAKKINEIIALTFLLVPPLLTFWFAWIQLGPLTCVFKGPHHLVRCDPARPSLVNRGKCAPTYSTFFPCSEIESNGGGGFLVGYRWLRTTTKVLSHYQGGPETRPLYSIWALGVFLNKFWKSDDFWHSAYRGLNICPCCQFSSE